LMRTFGISAPPSQVASSFQVMRRPTMMPTSKSKLRATCIITNYNYGAYLRQAIDSVLSQTTPFDEIIVVDDGSTDDSSVVLFELSKRVDKLQIFHREDNAGQLAAFETGIMQSSGDILFFLDADDVYSSDYLGIALDVYHKVPECDFLFCGHERFCDGLAPKALVRGPDNELHPQVTDLGLTIVRTLERKAFVGGPTSCLSLRLRLAKRLFPIPLHEDWRTRADDCLVFGASLAGARKFRVESNLVGYRIHGSNAFASNSETAKPAVFFLRQVALMRLLNFLRQKLNLEGEKLGKLAHLEFKTIPNPSAQDLYEYMGYVLKHGAQDAGRARGVAVILKRYFETKAADRPPIRAQKRLD
jgi:glycosyltransferase involved in cell wall biosynthesis